MILGCVSVCVCVHACVYFVGILWGGIGGMFLMLLELSFLIYKIKIIDLAEFF